MDMDSVRSEKNLHDFEILIPAEFGASIQS